MRRSLDRLCWKMFGLLKGPLYIGVEVLQAVAYSQWTLQRSRGLETLMATPCSDRG